MDKIRKAVIAGLGAVLTAIIAGVQGGAPATADGWVALAVGAVGAGLLVAWATWRVPNAAASPQLRPGRPPL